MRSHLLSTLLSAMILMAPWPEEMEESMPLRPISRSTAEHYAWGEKCDAWRLVNDPRLSVIEEEMPSGAAETLHYHKGAQQFFYVLAGEAVMMSESGVVRLSAGEGLRIPAGTPHQIRNLSNQPVRFLVISEPPSHEDRVDLGKRG